MPNPDSSSDRTETADANPPPADSGTAAESPASAARARDRSLGGPEYGTVSVPGFEVLAELGRGGMGVVFRARDPKLNRAVALKVLRPESFATPAEVTRFRREAEAAAQLDHPHIVPVFNVGEANGRPFYTMGFIEGKSLGDRLDIGPVDNRTAARIARQVAEAVAYAHARGVVHRDIKPDNVLLDREGNAHVTDFGIARRTGVGEEQDDALGLVPAADLRRATMTGAVLGTPSFMAPEQATDAKQAGPAADVYAVGGLLYAMLTGRPPFLGTTVLDTLELVLGTEPVPPRRLNLGADRDLETICLKCLRKDPARRYASAAELAADLARWQAGQAISARPVGRVERLARFFDSNPAVLPVLAGLTTRGLLGTQEGVFVGLMLFCMRLPLPGRADADTLRQGLARGVLYGAVLAAIMTVYVSWAGAPPPKTVNGVAPPSLSPWEWVWESGAREIGVAALSGAILGIILASGWASLMAWNDRWDDDWTVWYTELLKYALYLFVPLVPLLAYYHAMRADPSLAFTVLSIKVETLIGIGMVLTGIILLLVAVVIVPRLLKLLTGWVENRIPLLGPVVGIGNVIIGLAIVGIIAIIFIGAVREQGAPRWLGFTGVNGKIRTDSESSWVGFLWFLDRRVALWGTWFLAACLGVTLGAWLGGLRRRIQRLPVPDPHGTAGAFLLGAVAAAVAWAYLLRDRFPGSPAVLTYFGPGPGTAATVELVGDWAAVSGAWPLLVLVKVAVLAGPVLLGGVAAVTLFTIWTYAARLGRRFLVRRALT